MTADAVIIQPPRYPLAGLHALIAAVCHRYVRNPMDAEDLAQDATVHLLTNAIPKFDPGRDVLLSTFVYRCTENFARNHVLEADDTQDLEHLYIQAPSTFDDRHVEAIAAEVLANPEKFLTRRQCRAFKALIAAPDARLSTIAAKLGYRNQSSLTMIKQRIRARVGELVCR